MSKRIRDWFLLAIGGAVTLAIVLWLVPFGDESQTRISPNNFSPARMEADQHLKENGLIAAMSSNRRLVEQDPFDGHARFRLGKGMFRSIRELGDTLPQIEEEEGLDSDRYVEVKKQMESQAGEAIQCFEACTDFARYRAKSLAAIALLHGRCGRDDEALEFFGQAIREGYRIQGIQGVDSFSFLDKRPEMKVLRLQEQRNRSRFYLPLDRSSPFYRSE